MNNEIDKAVDDAFNAVGSLFKKKKKKNKRDTTANGADTKQENDAAKDSQEDADDERANDFLNGLLGGNKDFEPFVNETNFSLTMDLTTTNKRGKTTQMLMRMALAPTKTGQKIVQTHKGKEVVTHSIFDTQEGTTTIITETEDGPTAIRTRTPNLSAFMDETDVQDYVNDIKVTDTGITKTIDGYACRKYTYVDGDGNQSETWLTREINLGHEQLYKAMTAMIGGGGGGTQMPNTGELPMEGFPIHSVTVTPKGETHEVHYRDVKIGVGEMDRGAVEIPAGIEIMDLSRF